MEVKDHNNNWNIVCVVYGTDVGSKPVAEDCDPGTYTQQLFNTNQDGNWEQIDPKNQIIVIPDTSGSGSGGVALSSVTDVSISRSQWDPWIILDWEYPGAYSDVAYYDGSGARRTVGDSTNRWNNYWFNSDQLNNANDDPANVTIGNTVINIGPGETLFEIKISDTDISYGIVDRSVRRSPVSAQ